MTVHVVDVNECTSQSPSPCPSDAVCVNAVGSYYCRCALGFEWDDATNSCLSKYNPVSTYRCANKP